VADILIVDDLSDNRDILVSLLGHHGHRLVEAVYGHEGLAATRAEHFDLVITDVLMPQMDGYEFARQLRLDPATSEIPVVFYSASYSETEARALARAIGTSDVLMKPVVTAEALRIVDHLLSPDAEHATASANGHAPAPRGRGHLRLLSRTAAENTGAVMTSAVRLRALINIGLDLASERDSNRLLDSVCVAAREFFGATYVTLGILDRDDRTVTQSVSCIVDASWIKSGDAVPGILAKVVEGRTMRGQNLGGDPASLQLPGQHPEVRSYLAVPLASAAYVHGWLCLVENGGRTFTEDDEQLALALAAQVGRLYELEHEILQRKQAESALRHERDEAQRYLDAAEVVLVALDLNGRITLINRKGCDILGRSESELLGHEWTSTCLPERKRTVGRYKFHALLGGGLPIDEDVVRSKSGGERLIEWRNTLEHASTAFVIGTFSSGSDITVRTKAVEALRIAEERMRFALKSAEVGIWDIDYATGVLQWSETVEAQYGLQPGTFGGTFEAFVERIHPEDRDSALETFERAMKSGADFSIVNRSLWPDGTVRWLRGAGRILLDKDGQPVRGVGISLDDTQRRTLEEQYRQAQKMETVGRLAGGVAHDFNNLLTVILGYCEILGAGLAGDPRAADVAEIHKAGTRAAGLTRQLLAFSRKQIIAPTLLDLNAVVTGLQSLLGHLIAEDISVVLRLRTGLSLVKADRGQVEQVVMNLAVNARDAMPNGGTLTFDTASVELDEHYAKTHLGVTPGAYVRLTMTDTGTGMTPQVQARLFEPFFTTKEPGKGTGLGMATVYGIVTRCGGSVGVYSEVGKGTSFKVYFPNSESLEPFADEAAPVAGPLVGTETVLVVEDQLELRELAKRLLQQQGYTVLVAANAAEAVRLFHEHPAIDLVVTDVVMPGASGPELTRQLMEQRPALKVIYVSGYTEDAIVEHGVLTPGIAFLDKPFTSETLGRKVREVLEQ